MLNKIQSIISKESHSAQLENKSLASWLLPNNIVIAFDKEFFNEYDVLQIIGEQKSFSNKFVKWTTIEEKGERILQIGLRKESIENNNKTAFEEFRIKNINNPIYANKFVAFVNGEFVGLGEVKNQLVKETYLKYGNVKMYVGKIAELQKRKIIIDTPELI